MPVLKRLAVAAVPAANGRPPLNSPRNDRFFVDDTAALAEVSLIGLDHRLAHIVLSAPGNGNFFRTRFLTIYVSDAVQE